MHCLLTLWLLTHIVAKILETGAKFLQYACLTNLLLALDKPFFSHMPLQLLHWLFSMDKVWISNLNVFTFMKIVNYVYKKYSQIITSLLCVYLYCAVHTFSHDSIMLADVLVWGTVLTS